VEGFFVRVVIFSNGEIKHPALDRSHLKVEDKIYAANGGLHHILAFDLLPDIVIGDLDSIENGIIRRLESKAIEILQHPTRKDETDLELALKTAVERGAEQILILGGLGGRWDQTIANVLLSTLPELKERQVTFIDGLQELRLLRPGQHRIQGVTGETISLIPLGGDATGVETHGLEYVLRGEALAFGATRGVSNVLARERASVSFESGSLLLVHHRVELVKAPNREGDENG
jgi:thiamine pyrophosphokinase